ncbi:amino acid adenylation domain-containing protein [Streptomyces sp. NPDC050704]|uniref:amino acid adenylation domain-containing protein n=1 Tax=Streptomyces sp. NPDC050704 TaxID=3157219 RepID=UPI00343E7942
MSDTPVATGPARHPARHPARPAGQPATGGCLHDMVADHARRAPGAVAVEFGDGHLTYAELDSRAETLARGLRELGVRPGQVVGIAVERSVELVVGLLGILKTGAAYLPVDPDYPRRRIAFMLADTGASVLLTQRRLLPRLPDHDLVRCLDDDWPAAAARDTPPVPAHTAPDDPAYVIYTSGSTGTPKGVMVSHTSLITLLRPCSFARLDEDETLLQFVSISFDVAMFELWGALVNGGRLVVAPPGPLSAEELADLVQRHGVTTLWLTAGLLPHLTPPVTRRLRGLRQLLAGGDVLPPKACAALLADLPETALVNGYGPTEATVFAAAHRVTADGLEPSVPIGRAVAGTRLHVLDGDLRPVPDGTPGELHIGGAGVAFGYHGRPALTARRFVPDPFSDRPGSRLYRTGDQVLRLPDGALRFLGRTDGQTKIRGFRVEPGEVETALTAHPGVHHAVVTVLAGEDAGHRRLVGYVVLRPGEAAREDLVGELREHLRRTLPDHMVPGALLVLDAFPLTPSGKIDRAALPHPAAAVSATPFTAATSALQDAVAELCADVLGLDRPRLAPHEDFFALGGDSLLATGLVSRIRQVLGVELPLREVFDRPTPAALEPRIRAALGERTGSPPVVPAPREGPLPLTHSQQRLWFLDQLEPETATYNLPSLFRLRGGLDAAALRRALRELATRHEVLRTAYPARDGEPRRVCLPPADVPLAIDDLRALPGDERPRRATQLIAEDVATPFDLARGPLLRARLVRSAEDEHLLLVTVHHIVCDGWSMDVILRDLSELYAAIAEERPAALRPLPVQYGDYAVWQRDRSSGPALEEQLAYWTRQLDEAPPVLELPADRPRPPVRTSTGGTHWIDIPAPLARAVADTARAEDSTVFMTLLAAFALVLRRQCDRDDIVVGTPVAGRTSLETEDLIGLFMNTLALRVDLSGDPTVRDLLRRVRELTVDACTHQELPFERLVEALRPDRDLARTPLVQILFNHIVLHEDDVRAGGLHWRREPVDEVAAKFDLSLYVWEGARGTRCQFIFNADLYDAERIHSLAGQYLEAVRALCADPSAALSSISLSTPEWRRRTTARPPARSAPPDLATRILDTAARHPDRRAVTGPEGDCTYGELVLRAGRLAATLHAHGVGRGDVVAVPAARSAWSQATALAVAWTGAVFAPLDPAHPTPWLRQRLAQLRPAAVVDLHGGHDLAGPTVIRTEHLPDRAAAPPAARTADPTAPAFVLFTSGSTGTPKGVVSSQLPLCRFLDWQADRFGLGERDRFGALSGLGHDPVLRDMFAGLWSGGEVHWPDEDSAREPALTAHWLRRQAVTALHLPPPLLDLITTADDTPVPALRHLFFGAAPLRRAHVRAARRWAPEAEYVNFYGTTETPQAAAFFPVPRGLRLPGVPIGTGTAEARILVLDPSGTPAGPGELGEIAVRSPYLALGYLADDGHPAPGGDLAVDRNAFAAGQYRTGDLGRFRPDGTVDLVGRRDRRIDLRGFRIEPAEIETALAAHPDLWEAAVTAHDERLVAYVVPAPGAAPTPGEVRAHLAEVLPAQLVPHRVVLTDMLPMTSNGKVDLDALAALDLAVAPPAAGHRAPSGTVERELAALWQEVLGAPPAHRDQSFFEVGHSLLAAQYVARIRQRLGVRVPLRALFAHPTVATLAGLVKEPAGLVEEPR